MQSVKHICLLGLVSLVLCGCHSSSPRVPSDLQTTFSDKINISDMNTSLQIRSDSNSPTKVGSELYLFLENKSQNPIYIPASDSMFRLFIIVNDDWVEIDNKIQYFGEETKLGTIGRNDSTLRIAVIPILPDGTQLAEDETVLRVLFIGETLASDPGGRVPVGAFVDTFISDD